MFGKNGRRPPAIRLIKNSVVLLCLLAPSAWMIANIPPLWRDADAYVQLTERPLVATFWNHAPAYCYLAKIPLYLGEQIEHWQGKPPRPRLTDPSQPALTDTGIWILLVAQHLALGIAVFLFIAAVTRSFWVRLALAAAWASTAMPYTFAHCLGSETLGLVLIVILTFEGLQLVQSKVEPNWKQWYRYAVVLLLSIMARELNLGLTLVLPATFLLSWLIKKVADPTGARTDRTRFLQNSVIATSLSICCVLMADSIEQGLARKTRLHPHSRIGFTFLWRLHFLGHLPPETRAAVLEKVNARAPNDGVRYLIKLIADMNADPATLSHPGPFMNRAIGYFGGHFHWEDLDRALNQMAFTFLWPPPPELLRAAKADFIGAMKAPSSAISEQLFLVTGYYFKNKDEVPGCAGLVTFRDGMSPETLAKLFSGHRYFHFWSRLPYLGAVGVWVVSLLLYVVLRLRRRAHPPNLAPYAVALPVAGLLMFVVSCVLHDYEPRFTFSMWELLLLSLLLLIGRTADLWAGGNSLIGAREASPPGSHCRPEP